MSRECCLNCCRPIAHCLCALLTCLPNRVRVLVLQHPDEQRHALNTARLAVLGLAQAQLEVGESFAELDAWLEPYYSVLLFPGEDAQELPCQAPLTAGRTLQLVVPDGTWRKARKLLYLNPQLAQLPRVCLPSGLTSRYRLRKAPSPGALSTIEAISYALQLQEQTDFSALLKPFDALIEGQITAMGQALYQRNYQQNTF